MAKLRHPNAVAVYEVGEHGGQVYVAMEEVDGGTLRDVLAERERRGEDDWRQVVERFVEAGRGLAAAHAQGMVHRDFKPDNVLVDASGRVLVGDFGLVSGARDRAAKDGDRDALADTDAVVGTPAYMAPEQHRGRDVDGRADQFAFCVALYEALYGELPFAGQTAGERARAVERGDVRPPRRDKKVPGWLRETLLRGLAAEPEARHPSMAALLSELGADPEGVWRVGRRMRVAMVAVFAAFTIAWVFSVIALGIEISYGILYATNAAFAGVMLAVAWIGRHAFARTAFNRKIIGSGLMVAALILALVAGGHLLAVAPVALGILHLFSFGVAFCIGAISIDSRLGRAGAVYVIAFLVASAWPSLYVPIHLAANAVGAFTFYIVVATSRSSER